MSARRFPPELLLGASALALAAAANLASALPASLPAGIGTVGYPIFYRTAAHTQVRTYAVVAALFPLFLAGALLVWERLEPRARRAAAAAAAALIVVILALPPFGDGSQLGPAMAGALVVCALLVLADLDARRSGGGLAAFAALPGAAVGLWLVSAGIRPPGAVLVGAMAAGIGVFVALSRAMAAPLVLAQLAPIGLLALDGACRARLMNGAMVAGGYEIPHHRIVLLALAATGALVINGIALRNPAYWNPRRARHLVLWLALPLLVCALRFQYRVHTSDIDGLHEGEPLASAAAIEAGARPYRDVVFFHGLGEDPGRALLGFRLFGRSVRGLRVFDDLAAAVDAGVLAVVGVAVLPARWALLLAAALAAGALPAPTASRFLLADAATVVLVLALREAGRRSARWAAGAGVLAALALLWGLDTGSATLIAGAGAFGLRAFVIRDRRRDALAFAAGAGGVLVAFGAWLLALGLLSAFVAMARQVAGSFALAYARPWEFRSGDAEGVLTTIIAPLALIAGAALLVLLGLRRDASARTWIVLLVWLEAFLLFERGLDRHDDAHINAAARMVWVLLAAVVCRWRRAEPALAAAVTAVLLLPPGVARLPAAVQEFAARSDVDISGRSLIDVPRTGVLVSADQARSLSALLSVLGRMPGGSTFYDFTNHGALYFLADRPLPTRYTQVWLAVSLEAQREVVTALRRRPPAVVVFRSGTGYDALDHIDNRVRHPLVAERLVAAYRPFATVGGSLLLAEAGQAPLSAWPQVYDVVALRSVPVVWGAAGFDAMHVRGLAIAATGDGGARIALTDEARAHTAALALRLASVRAESAKLTWRMPGAAAGEEAGVTFDLLPGREPREYLVPLASLPAWVWPEQLEAVELRLAGSEGLDAGAVEAAAVEGTLDDLAPR